MFLKDFSLSRQKEIYNIFLEADCMDTFAGFTKQLFNALFDSVTLSLIEY